MKRLAIFLLWLVAAPLLGWAQVGGAHKYIGKIGDNLYITMELGVKINQSSVIYSGYYYYNTIGQPITLKGGYDVYGANDADPNAEDCIYEYVDQKLTGVLCFKRNAIGQHYLLGTWKDPESKRIYKVSLEKVEL